MKYICCECGKPTDNIEEVNMATNSFSYSKCDECKERWSREYDWQNENETSDERQLICPHCGHEYDDYDAYGFDEGKTEEIICELCGKKFDLEVECVRRFSTKRSVCEMPDDYGIEEEK